MTLPSHTKTLTAALMLLHLALVTLTGCSKPVPPSSPPPTPYPGKVRVIVDSSKSMAGYVAGGSEFKETIANMAASLDRLSRRNQGLNNIDYMLLGNGGTLTPLNVSTNDFIRQLHSNSLMREGDSLLSTAFKNMIDTTGSGQVSMLVTDSIVSYSDIEVRRNPSINRENLASLGAEIETVFAPAAQKGISVFLFAGLSSFHGTYFDYANHHINCCAGKRPFYVWVVGPSAEAQALAAYLEQQRDLYFAQELSVGGKTLPVKAAVLQTLRRAPGSVYFRGRSGVSVLEAKTFPRNGPLRFGVALDLHALPLSAQTPEFLRQHLALADTDRAMAIEEVVTRSQVESDKPNDAESVLPAYTHVVFITLQPAFRDGDKATLMVDGALPGWYRQWSNKDDSATATEKGPTTFGFAYLVDGVAKAISDGSPAAQTSITVRK